jgi:hypothetical protein
VTIVRAGGAAGLSAYDIWLGQGNTGSVSDFLSSLIGPPGATGPQGEAGTGGSGSSDMSPYALAEELIRTTTSIASISSAGAFGSGTEVYVPLFTAMMPCSLIDCSIIFPGTANPVIASQSSSAYWTCEIGKHVAYALNEGEDSGGQVDRDTLPTFVSIAAKRTWGAWSDGGGDTVSGGESPRARLPWGFDAQVWDFTQVKLMEDDTVFARWSKQGSPGAIPANLIYNCRTEPLRW